MQTSFPASPKLVFLTSLSANHSLSWFAWRLLYKLTNNNFETNLLSTFILQVGDHHTCLPRNTNLGEILGLAIQCRLVKMSHHWVF